MPSHALRRLAALALTVPALVGVCAAAASADEVTDSTVVVVEDAAPAEETTPTEEAAPAEETAPAPVTYSALYTRW
jgi:hypothetical protein